MLKKRLDISEKLFSFPKQMEKYLPGFEQDGYKLEKVSLDKLAKDNNLYDDKDLNYHTRIWGTDASNYKFDDSAVDKWFGSDMIYGIKHKDGSIELGNGRHRCRALLNSGYNEIEMPILVESFETDKFMPDTAGYVLPDGRFAILDEYHGEDNEYKGKGYPEFSATHPEEDTCIRLYSEPNEIQYKKLEDIIDYYLESSGYCKVEVWKGNRYLFYKVYSLYPDACQDYAWDEELGNWTGEKLVRIIKNYFRNNLNESLSRDEMIGELRRLGKNYKFEKYSNEQIFMIYMRTLNSLNKKKQPSKPIIKPQDKYCPECGMKLNPLGECPVCDLGEEDMLDEDTIKVKDGKWVNKGKEGTHGTFKTKKAADAQRKAMFANGWHEDLNEDYKVDIIYKDPEGQKKVLKNVDYQRLERTQKAMKDNGCEIIGTTPSDVDENLNEKIEKHETLNPKIWNEDKTLKDEVKEKILEIVDKFKHQLEEKGVKLDIADIYLLGSNANYNYTNDSDLDIHIMANEESDCLDKHLPIIYDAYKKIFNDKYDITINGINVELYVENINDSSNVATGVYSLNKGWIKEPTELTVPEIDEDEVEKRVDEWENKYYAILDNPSIEAIDNYLDELNLMRAEALKEEGEFAIDNLVFKELRNLNYIRDLKELKVELESKELSL